jgi:hypothetical protein
LLLRWSPRFPAQRRQPAQPRGWCFPRLLATTRGRLQYCSLLTFYYAGFRQRSLHDQRHSLGLGEGSGLLGSRRGNFLSRRRTGFISFPGQVSRFPAQYKIGDQQSKTTKLQVLLGKGLHLQARPDDSHSRGAKYAGDVYKPGFGGRLLFSLSRCRFFSTNSCARFRPALHGRRLRLDNSSRPLCHLRHKFFYGGGWAAASLSRLAHCLPVVSFPLDNGVGWWNLLQEPRIQFSAYTVLQDKYSTTLLEEHTS